MSRLYYFLMGLMLLITGADLSAREDFDLASLAVPDSVEADSGYNRLLQHYNYYCIKGDKFPEFDRDSLAALFRRPSFFSMTVNLMREENDPVNNIMYKDAPLLWADSVPNILLNCTDKEIVYSIVDRLLLYGEIRWFYVLWESCDINKLHNYQSYKRSLVEKGNFLILAEFAVICHNSKNGREKKKLLREINRLSPQSARYLKELFSTHETISYSEYTFEYFEELVK